MTAGVLDFTSSPIRPLDTRKDLMAVADLIQICFEKTLDREGLDYLRHIRRAARDARYLRWVPGALESVSMPLYGYVWEEDHRVVGNLSLIPFWRQGKWIYMIANVAVHPDFRRRGIARQLTSRAIEHIRDHGAAAGWLQVREENEPAIKLYHSLGFIERARRTTWIGESFPPLDFSIPGGWKVQPRLANQWLRHSGWLKRMYPPEITWNIPLNLNQFKPGFWRDLMRWLDGKVLSHWSATKAEELFGVLSYEPTTGYQDTLWLALSDELPEGACKALLACGLRLAEKRKKGVTLNLPAGLMPGMMEELNFEAHQTLIWMEIRFPPRYK